MLKFKIDNLYIRFFYIILAYILAGLSYEYFKPHIMNPIPIWTAKFIPFIFENQLAHQLYYYLTLFILLLTTVFPVFFLRVLCSILVITFFAIYYSFGKIDHPYHCWIIASIFMIISTPKQDYKSLRNQISLRLIQSMMLMHYFISGFWKLRYLLFKNNQSASLYEFAIEHMAISTSQGASSNILIELLHNNELLLTTSYTLVLILQLSAIIPIILGKYFTVYGIMFICFHILTGITLDIWFYGTIFGLIFFFILPKILFSKLEHISFKV
jgi:hypothetical protein